MGVVGTWWGKLSQGESCRVRVGQVGTRSGMSERNRVSRNGVNASHLGYGGVNGNDKSRIHLQSSVIIYFEFQPM